MTELLAVADDTFYGPLMLFGCAEEKNRGFVGGEGEQLIGRMLSLFQELNNYVDRCNALTVNVIHQLASLYHARQKLYQYTFRQVHLLPPFEGMAELLAVLVRVDSIIAHNPNIEDA